jgi:hypothetical protein
LALAGCAIQPHGPVVQHTVKTYFPGRPDHLAAEETWKDNAFSRGLFLFADPELSTVTVWHTNQSALGGCSHFSAGSVAIHVDTNLVPAISATGTAAGNILGATVKSAVK